MTELRVREVKTTLKGEQLHRDRFKHRAELV